VKRIALKVKEAYQDVDWETIHEAGCTCDDTDLPEHVSTQEEIRSLIGISLKSMLEELPSRPTIVTISRYTMLKY
jgi:hypothetical protein